ncbi:hypothetical protein D9756_009726 [Leucocoprinus leucothites]|uniref:Velvet domain-containing protein n=1 Tax=Leucocoprinus leucothites TaxID=201217 RepID=A0A8H5CWC6_9AGAR|nr:hypothetical protein D9756_009726 [Leucoagaricus leucothites]
MHHHGPTATGKRDFLQSSSSQDSITPGATVDPVLINRPIQFSSGQFAGETVRYELKEIQKACLGRKYARVDRRPLDPPPVVLVRIWRYSPETGKEEEVNYEYDLFHLDIKKELCHSFNYYSEVQTHGLLCTVDLFPVPAKTSKDLPPSSTTSGHRTSKTIQTNDGFVHFNPSGPSPTPSLSPSPSYRPQSYGPSDIVHYYEGIYPLLERSKTTQALVGATFVQPVLVELFGKKCIAFVFSDLAVKSEGTFTLRYRIFDLFSPNVEPHRLAQSPPGPYPTTPSALSISPTPSPTSVSGFSPSPPSYVHSSSLARTAQPQYQRCSMQSQFQSHPTQHPHQTSMNPYPDPSQDYTAPPPVPQQPRSRRSQQEPEESPDYQAVFAPHEVQTRIEPSERGASLSILAECWAKGSFRIFSTKEFPGLPASTDLTKVRRAIFMAFVFCGTNWAFLNRGMQQLAIWGVRLNIRETERRRRRRSMIDQPEEESRSDGEIDDVAETMAPMREPQRPLPRKATNIKPRPTPTNSPDYKGSPSPSSSSTQQSHQRRISPLPSPTSALGYGKHRPRQDSEGYDEYERERGQGRPEVGVETVDYDENSSNYSHSSDRFRNPSRSSIHSGIPAFQPLMYSSTSAPFDPAPSSSLTHTQPHLSTSPTSQTHFGYGVSVQPQVHNAPPTHSGMRPSINGTGHFEDSQNAPTSTAAFSRYASSARKRDSDGSLSTTSRRSAGSVGSVGEFQGMAPSFHAYGAGHGMDGNPRT